MKEAPTCHYCTQPGTTKDHVVPRAKLKRLSMGVGNPFRHLNLVPACVDCNNRKGKKRSTCTCDLCTALWTAYALMCQGRGLRRGTKWLRERREDQRRRASVPVH